MIVTLLSSIWINTLANRIRDYGGNPWNALWSLVPLVNIGLAFYYGIVKEKTKEKDINSKNDTSLTKAVVNHTKDIACDIKPKIHEYIEKHSDLECEDKDIVTDNYNDIHKLSEDEIYEKIMLEIEEDKKIKSTWAKAFSQSAGDENKAKALYINLRVEEIKIEEERKINQILKEKEKRLLEIKEQEYFQNELKYGLTALETFKKKHQILSVKKIEDTLYSATFNNSPIDVYIQWNGHNWEFQK